MCYWYAYTDIKGWKCVYFFHVQSIVAHNFVYIQLCCDPSVAHKYTHTHTLSLFHLHSSFSVDFPYDEIDWSTSFDFAILHPSMHDDVLYYSHLFIHYVWFLSYLFSFHHFSIAFRKWCAVYMCVTHSVCCMFARINGMMIYQKRLPIFSQYIYQQKKNTHKWLYVFLRFDDAHSNWMCIKAVESPPGINNNLCTHTRRRWHKYKQNTKNIVKRMKKKLIPLNRIISSRLSLYVELMIVSLGIVIYAPIISNSCGNLSNQNTHANATLRHL